MATTELSHRERIGFARTFNGYARIGSSFSIDGKRLWYGSGWGITLASRDGCFMIGRWQRGRWWTWRAINKLQVVTSYHPRFLCDGLPPRLCLHEDLPGEITSQGYWPFRPEEVKFAVVPRPCIAEVRYRWWGELTLQTADAVIGIWTRPFSRGRLTTVLQGFHWPELK